VKEIIIGSAAQVRIVQTSLLRSIATVRSAPRKLGRLCANHSEIVYSKYEG